MSSLSPDMVRIYLQEIGRYPMLTADQEIAYGRQVQQIMAIEQRKNVLTQQLDREPTMVELAVDIEKSELEIAQIQKLGQRAKQKMVTANLRLVVSIAKKYQKRNLELLDLLQEGAIGLQRGVGARCHLSQPNLKPHTQKPVISRVSAFQACHSIMTQYSEST